MVEVVRTNFSAMLILAKIVTPPNNLIQNDAGRLSVTLPLKTSQTT